MRHAIGDVLYTIVLVYLLLLLARWIFSLLVGLAGIRPSGAAAALAEITYASTDPVVRPLDRWLPTFRFGRFLLPMGYLVAVMTTYVLLGVVRDL